MLNKKENALGGHNCYILVLIVSSIILLLLSLLFVNSDYVLNNISDEYGYLSNAAYMAGKDWSELTSFGSAYYSYGYSFLLIPLFLLFDDFTIIYRIAMGLNIFCLLLGFYFAIACTKKLFKTANETLIVIVNLVVALYTSNIVFAKWIWGESLLYLLYWIVIYLLQKIEEKGRIRTAMLLVITLAYMWAVHQRALVVIIAVVIYFLVKFLLNKDKLWDIGVKQICLTLGVICIVTYISLIMKQYIQNNLYYNEALSGMNNMKGITNNILGYISWQGVKTFINGSIGKIFYFVFSTLFIGCYGIWFCLKNTYNNLLGWKKEDSKNSSKSYLPLFFLLCLIGGVLLNVIFTMSDYTRHDLLIYGRYMEWLFGPILICGFFELTVAENRIKKFMAFLIIGIISAFCVSHAWGYEGVTQYKSFFSSGIVSYFFLLDKIKLKQIPILILIIRGGLFLIILVLMKLLKLNKNRCLLLLSVISAVLWSYNAIKYDKSAFDFQKTIVSEYNTIADNVSEIAGEDTIYFIYGNEFADDMWNIRRIQILLMDNVIEPIKSSKLKKNNKGIYLLSMSLPDCEQTQELFKNVIEINGWLILYN